jgi:hypothetical protein
MPGTERVIAFSQLAVKGLTLTLTLLLMLSLLNHSKRLSCKDSVVIKLDLDRVHLLSLRATQNARKQ